MLSEKPPAPVPVPLADELRPRPERKNFGGSWGSRTGVAIAATRAAAPRVRAITEYLYNPSESIVPLTGVRATVMVVPHRRRMALPCLATRMSHMTVSYTHLTLPT